MNTFWKKMTALGLGLAFSLLSATVAPANSGGEGFDFTDEKSASEEWNAMKKQKEEEAERKRKEKEEAAAQKKKEQEEAKKEKAAERRKNKIENALINTGAQILKRGLLNTLFK